MKGCGHDDEFEKPSRPGQWPGDGGGPEADNEHNAKDEAMKKVAKIGFWEPGFSIFTDELAKAEKVRLSPLKDEMKKATDPIVKARLKKEIENIKTEFKAKRESAKHSLFAKT